MCITMPAMTKYANKIVLLSGKVKRKLMTKCDLNKLNCMYGVSFIFPRGLKHFVYT